MLIIRRPLIITIFLYKLISPLGSPAAVEASTVVMELYMDTRIGEMTDTTNNQLFEGDFRFYLIINYLEVNKHLILVRA